MKYLDFLKLIRKVLEKQDVLTAAVTKIISGVQDLFEILKSEQVPAMGLDEIYTEEMIALEASVDNELFPNAPFQAGGERLKRLFQFLSNSGLLDLLLLVVLKDE